MHSMRLLLLSVASSLMFVSAAHAQISAAEIGVVGGLNIARFSGAEGQQQKGRNGIMLGLSANIVVTERFSIQPELLYTQKGTRIEEESVDGEFSYFVKSVLKLNYLELPILARIAFPMSSNSVVPFIYGGPAIGVNVGCRVKYEFHLPPFGSESGSSRCYTEIEGEELELARINPVEFGVVLGGGITFRNFSLGVRYGRGLTNISNELGDDDAKNSVLSVVGRYVVRPHR
jgi:hypothetical protein